MFLATYKMFPIQRFFIAFVILLILFSGGFAATQPVFADRHEDLEYTTDNTTSTNPSPTTSDLKKLKNPLEGSVDSIPNFVETLLNIVLMIGVPLVALAIIYSGFLFVAAQGNPEKLKEAKKTFGFTLLGAAIILGAFVIANAIGGTINELRV